MKNYQPKIPFWPILRPKDHKKIRCKEVIVTKTKVIYGLRLVVAKTKAKYGGVGIIDVKAIHTYS
jgi:hypothetical protein